MGGGEGSGLLPSTNGDYLPSVMFRESLGHPLLFQGMRPLARKKACTWNKLKLLAWAARPVLHRRPSLWALSQVSLPDGTGTRQVPELLSEEMAVLQALSPFLCRPSELQRNFNFTSVDSRMGAEGTKGKYISF